jgi:hypothetical protein
VTERAQGGSHKLAGRGGWARFVDCGRLHDSALDQPAHSWQECWALPRTQEFVELVRAGQQLEAVAYARRHLAPWAPQHMAELQRAAALLAFQAGTQCAPYKALFAGERVGAMPGQRGGRVVGEAGRRSHCSRD